MGMSTHVTGFRLPDEKYEQMREVWNACNAANVPVPEAVEAFFEYSPPSDYGTEVHVPSTEWVGNTQEGVEVRVDLIPEGVHVIRFYNSY